ncbi:type II toxin-antitoxin system RelE/ParE family toxin [Thauera sp.]|uniref:type II toxin-antitoxin system RelE/ParE family toxin n=1 Tax=Thauera sp. TaxID=1905334 RepID=UPI002BCEB7CB|nr:type II toxin-antitoxin system RelE/ParE family toxin [Thauera sp.]HRO34847.1 type II toxin-antitoxin system RelE/ParE family toxin [Thauera sp.]
MRTRANAAPNLERKDRGVREDIEREWALSVTELCAKIGHVLHIGQETGSELAETTLLLALHAVKRRVMLFALDKAKGPEDINAPGWRLHPLERELAGHWSVWVNGNWRVTCTFEGEHAVLVDYRDYH